MSIYETHIMKDPQLPFIFHEATCLRSDSRRVTQTNWHENPEILFVVSGEGTLICDAQQLHVTAGDIAVINANCLHGLAVEADHLIYHCLIVDRGFCIANHFDTNEIQFQTLLRDDTLQACLRILLAEYRGDPAAPYRTQTIRATVLQIMATLCRHHSKPYCTAHSESHLLACIRQAIGLIRSESAKELSLDQISAFVGLSKYYFAREFRRVTGYTFVSYVNMVRCERAKILLLEDRPSIGEVGRICGFANQSYFTRTFRAYTGLLPGAYREKRLREARKTETDTINLPKEGNQYDRTQTE